MTPPFNCRLPAFLKKARLFQRHKKEWQRQGGQITSIHKILNDFADTAGTTSGHYFHQDLLIASFIAAQNPKRHIDVGSRIDGFVAHVASFREIEVVDIRPLPVSQHSNLKYVQADLMEPSRLGQTDSLSCLHAIEHFGLGRYSDPINVDGHIRGIENLVSLLAAGGILYISFPIGLRDEVHFNAHRIFHPRSIFTVTSVAENLKLERFDFVDDAGDLHLDVDVDEAIGKLRHGCGIYTFRKF